VCGREREREREMILVTNAYVSVNELEGVELACLVVLLREICYDA